MSGSQKWIKDCLIESVFDNRQTIGGCKVVKEEKEENGRVKEKKSDGFYERFSTIW